MIDDNFICEDNPNDTVPNVILELDLNVDRCIYQLECKNAGPCFLHIVHAAELQN